MKVCLSIHINIKAFSLNECLMLYKGGECEIILLYSVALWTL